MEGGLDRLFDLETQKTREQHVGLTITSPTELSYPADNPDHLDFGGAMGAYYREIYFYIPWLIARALRAAGKHQEALSWYGRICDFTASDSDHDTRRADRPWRYIDFRELTVPKLKAMLTDEAAIEAYNIEPFNPHAIARLRPSAYQRAIVMEIIGTYHDLGDSLFAKDTMESVNEASLYYTRAFEMLGPRPARLGRCHTIPDTDLTYEKLGPAVGKPSEMLLMLENWVYANHAAASVPTHLQAPAPHPGAAPPGTVTPHTPPHRQPPYGKCSGQLRSTQQRPDRFWPPTGHPPPDTPRAPRSRRPSRAGALPFPAGTRPPFPPSCRAPWLSASRPTRSFSACTTRWRTASSRSATA